MTRQNAPTVRVVGEHDDPYLLVRADTAEQAHELARAYLVDDDSELFWYPDEHPGPPPARAVSDGWWRWVPAQPDDDYRCWLHPASAGARGAFHAWEVTVGPYPVGDVVSAGAA